LRSKWKTPARATGEAAPGGAAHHGPGHAAGGLAAALVQALVDAGYRVIRFDNRDIGLSQHLTTWARPTWCGPASSTAGLHAAAPPYTLHDMAQDALGVLDALGVPRPTWWA
jgi:pimeloyl-ACP methyl ester carboxylesterase